LVDRSGNLLLNFHKKHLYESDKNWDCKEGKQFQVNIMYLKSIEITNINGDKIKCALGICMDINPYEFQDNNLYEFANHCLSSKVGKTFFKITK